MTTIIAGPILAHADAAVLAGRRIVQHSDAEATNDIDTVMATITPAEMLSWARTWSWSAPNLQPDGTVKVVVRTTREGIRDFYLGNRTRYNVTEIGRTHVRICSDWYALIESQAKFASIPDQVPYEQRWFLLSPLDGSEGITGEIAWGLFPQLAPADSVTEEQLTTLYYDYVDALRAQDIDALLSLMSEGVQGAVRSYTGDETFVNIDGAAAMREYYEQLFATVRVHAVDPVQFINRRWYLFSELRWQVEFLAGPRAGERGSLLIAEALPTDSDGRIYGRMGFGTELLG